jgi:hypothetical protein
MKWLLRKREIMDSLSKEKILQILRAGSTMDRINFVQSLPANGFKDSAVGLISSEQPAMAILALTPMISKYCYGENPEIGALLASAVFERALELYKGHDDHGGIINTTVTGLAASHLKALSLLGHSVDLIEHSQVYLKICMQLGEDENLKSIIILKVEALLNLHKIDDAGKLLEENPDLFKNPITGIEARRLQGWIDQYHKPPTELKTEKIIVPQGPKADDLKGLLKNVLNMSFKENQAPEIQMAVDKLDYAKHIDLNNPEQFDQLDTILEQGERFFTQGGGGQDNELSMRGRARKATSIFIPGKNPSKQQILTSQSELKVVLAWAKSHTVSDLSNDALWGLYLCESRLNRPSEAADYLIQLRSDLELIRTGINDPFKRAGVFGTYRYLFNTTCEKLYNANRSEDLLIAIESSKGRVIADRLSQQFGKVVPDSQINDSIKRLPEITARMGFHYVTFFVDEDQIYAVLVSNLGKIFIIDRIQFSSKDLRMACMAVDPLKWEMPIQWRIGSNFPCVNDYLEPIASWLGKLIEQGVIKKDDHICYSSDDDMCNIPFHYLRIGKGIVLDYVSVSRVHSAFHIVHLLERVRIEKFGSFSGFVSPAREDIEGKDSQMLADFNAPIDWLERAGLKGISYRLGDATPQAVKSAHLDNRIVHFSTHGWFPEATKNPFTDSFLVFSYEGKSPEREVAAKGEWKGIITPKNILDWQLDFRGSHVSIMACLSGLAKEGLAGDILGLDWAIIQQGASSLISTHWKVDSSCAASFFVKFYDKWICKKKPRCTAWRETMLELLNNDYTRESLNKWAAFSLTGDFR